MANQPGIHYECLNCGTVVLCVRKGDGDIACCQRSMIMMDYNLKYLEIPLG